MVQQPTEFEVMIDRLSSLDVAREVKKKLTELASSEELVFGKSYISRARPPNPPGSPLDFNPERAWETQWGLGTREWNEPPPEYSTEEVEELDSDKVVNDDDEEDVDVQNDVKDEEDDPPLYVSSVGWLPRQYGYELDEYNRQVEEVRRGWLPFCPLCNTTTQDVVTFNSEAALRIHMEQCCPVILEKSDKIKQLRHEKLSNFNGNIYHINMQLRGNKIPKSHPLPL